jgi:hypothetical protein
MNWRHTLQLGAMLMLTACSPTATRSPDWLLILNGEFPTAFNASENMGILYAEGLCIIFVVIGCGQVSACFS